MRDTPEDTPQSSQGNQPLLLDARDWHGPWCLLKIRGFQCRLGPGSLVRILIEDQDTARDLALFLEKQGHRILERTETEMLVRTSSEAAPALSRRDPDCANPAAPRRTKSCPNCRG